MTHHNNERPKDHLRVEDWDAIRVAHHADAVRVWQTPNNPGGCRLELLGVELDVRDLESVTPRYVIAPGFFYDEPKYAFLAAVSLLFGEACQRVMQRRPVSPDEQIRMAADALEVLYVATLHGYQIGGWARDLAVATRGRLRPPHRGPWPPLDGPLIGQAADIVVTAEGCTCSYDESEEMTRHAPLCALAGSW